MIEVRDFSKSYGSVRAVRDVSFDVNRGEIFGLLGPDGAGKTTTLRTIVTLLRPDAGAITIDGRGVNAHMKAIRASIGYMPQRFSLYPDLSVEQNLKFFAELFGVDKKEIPTRLARLYRFSRLDEFASRLAGRLSGGMKQKLALSCTLVHSPSVLVLDEPTTGVDPVSRAEFWNILSELRSEGITILVTTPYMDEAMLCDRLAIMHEGSILARGTSAEIIARFPYRLFEVRDRRARDHAESIRSWPEVVSMQTFGDSVHITTEKSCRAETLHRSLRAVMPDALMPSEIEPSLEDVFIMLIQYSDDRGTSGVERRSNDA